MDKWDDTLNKSIVEAFGIKCCTRYSRAVEMSRMLGFLCRLESLSNGEALLACIVELFYDSKSDTLCMVVTEQWRIVGSADMAPPRALMDAAMEHFPQWHFDGDAHIVISPKFEPKWGGA